MHIVLVNPIAATPALTPKGLVRPRIASLAGDRAQLEETNIVELGAALAALDQETTIVVGDVYTAGETIRLADNLRVAPVATQLRFPFHPAVMPLTPGLVNHPAVRDADVIQAGEFHQPATFFASRVAVENEVPLVVWQETFRPMRFPGSWYQRLHQATLGRTVRNAADRFIPRTTRARPYLQRLRVDPSTITQWIPTGIDLDRFRPEESMYSPAVFGWPAEAKLLLLVGRLHPDKGVDIALHVLKRLLRQEPRARLIVRGSGPERERLLQLARNLGIQEEVRFVGRLTREQMVHLYNAAHVALCTSRNDLLPFALIEASACGVPCVATDVGAVRDIVVDGVTGRVAETLDATAVEGALLRVLQNEGRREEFGRAARQRMETHFSLPEIARDLLEVYRGAGS